MRVDPAWRAAARRVLVAVGWAGEEMLERVFPGGASVAMTAPCDALYAATETLRATPMHQRSEQFTDLGGCITAPMADAWLYDEALWLVDLLGIHSTGTSRQSALSD